MSVRSVTWIHIPGTMHLCDMGYVCGESLPKGRDAMEVQHAVVDIDAQHKPAWDETCLHPHHWHIADQEVAKAFAVGWNSFPIGEIVWKKRSTPERAWWHTGFFECFVGIRKIVHENLLSRVQAFSHPTISDIDRILELQSS